MTRFNRTRFLVASALALAVAGRGSAAPPQKAEEAYKNVQVFKGYPADQIVPSMQFISAALGVDCEYCHVRGAFENDDKKPKQTARKMITMMAGINKASFEDRRAVTCFSCHHGVAQPTGTPPIAEQEPKEEEPAAKPASPIVADPILDKYLQALGGADALAKITSRVQKGTLSGFGGRQFPVDVFSKASEMRATVVHMPQGDNITAFDGQAGWLGNPGRPPRDMSAPEVEAARMDADLLFALRLKQIFKDFKVEPTEKIGGRDVVLVIAKNSGQPPVELYFDATSGLLLRLVRYAETPLGRNPTRIDYDDYRDADGVKVPFRWTVARPSGRFTIEVAEMQQNVPVDDAKFVKPPPAPAHPDGPRPGGTR